MLDNPNEVLYWCLRYGQRRQIAEEFGVVHPADHRLGELLASNLWLHRLSGCGSIVPALDSARSIHRAELRRIEDNIREFGAQHWRDELEQWRSHKYRILELLELEKHHAASPA